MSWVTDRHGRRLWPARQSSPIIGAHCGITPTIAEGIKDWQDCQSDNMNTACAVFDWVYHNRHRLWVSAGGGTHNTLAGILARHLSLSFDAAHELMRRSWLSDVLWDVCFCNQCLDTDCFTVDVQDVDTFLTRRDRRIMLEG